MNLAMITVIGRCVGARDYKQIQYYTKKLLRITYVCTVCLNVVILCTLPWTLKLYGLGEETTKLSFILVLIHNGAAMLLWPLAFTLPNMLRACNDVRFTMMVSVISMCLFQVGCAYILGEKMHIGAIGVWVAMICDWAVRACFFVGRYLYGKWKREAVA